MPEFTFVGRRSSTPKHLKRTVCVAHRCPLNFLSTNEIFCSNKIITSKYTAWNFLFKNLFEQFRRIANFYFLCIAIVQLSIKSPVSPLTSMLPLIFVVSVTAIKQAYEDWLRHKADNLVNHRAEYVLSNGEIKAIKAEDIEVGDIVMVENDMESPCDLVLLSSSNSDGHCHVMTANLDGETNLKDQICTGDIKSEELSSLYAVIECDTPNPDLYRFCGKLTIYKPFGERKIYSLNSKNLLLKGATLKNTDHVYGCAIYTGPDTKLVLNLKFTANKFSTVEKSLNKFLVIFLCILVMEATVGTICLLIVTIGYDYYGTWYIPEDTKITVGVVISDFLSFAVLFNYIIPISLYVTLDLVKFIGALFFVWDMDMYDPKSNEPAVCNSSDLNEELGQVEYLFTDKTGTLTENCMVFRQCSVLGTKFIEQDGNLRVVGDDVIDHDVLEHFLLVLVLCNTVQIYDNSNKHDCILEYFASSPDEKALVEACARFGVVLKKISNDNYEISTCTGTKMYRKLCTLEFDADRKRMSTIVEDDLGVIRVLCKGADSSVLSLIISGDKQLIKEHVGEYALAGLRTLVVAEKEISRTEYEVFEKKLHHAQCLLHDRDDTVARVYNSMEQDLVLLGATAVQDRLQENVGETIEALRTAGIKVWILTGDHADTALNVSYACGHVKRDMVRLTLLEVEDTDQCFHSLRQLRCCITEDPTKNYFLVMDGVSMLFAYAEHSNLLLDVSEMCVAVLCCRMSPLQKSQIVKLVKHSPSKPITAAIGDGANDVSMIQVAHVGIGIIGQEGRQAVRCSDFAFSRFHFLRKAILVHGQYYYMRAAMLVQYFFYKNVTFVLPQFIYIFFNWYSPQPLYNSVFLMMYNLCFTSLPIFIYGFTEKHRNEKKLLNNPILYKDLTKNSMLTLAQFAQWMLIGVWHALVAFFGIYLLWGESLVSPSSGRTFGMWSFGTTIFPIVVMIVTFKLALHTRYWTVMYSTSMLVSVLGFIFFTLLYCGVYWSVQTSVLYGVYTKILSSVQLWLVTLALLITALLPDVAILLINKHNLKPLSALRNVYHFFRDPHKFLHLKPEPGITLSQINILSDASVNPT